MAFTFADLFAGIGGFHAALAHAGGECVFVSEIDLEASAVYKDVWLEETAPGLFVNEQGDPVAVNRDIASATPLEGPLVGVPEHIDVLTAGFPCQPFSKSGYQGGMNETRGTLYWNIWRVLQERRPAVVLLENVRNLVGPRHTHEWDVIIDSLHGLGYKVSSTPTVLSPHQIPPSLGGTPQVRDRVFILATYVGSDGAPHPDDVEPTLRKGAIEGWDPQLWDISWALDDEDTVENWERYALPPHEEAWISFWDELVQQLPWHRPDKQRLPGFPLWAEHWVPLDSLNDVWLESLPAWKRDFMRKNARFFDENRAIIEPWKADKRYAMLPPSRRKLEWQAQESESLWDTVMHFRPSGIRCKKPTYLPALVAITQTSIIGPRRRRITPHEAARLQGLPRRFSFGQQRDAASYKQVGNGVCVGAAWYALRTHVDRDKALIPEHIVRAILDAPANPSPDSLWPAAVQFEKSVEQPGPPPMGF